MNQYEWLIPALVIGTWSLEAVADVLNLRHGGSEPPPELRDLYDAAKYQQTRKYLAANTRFGLVHATVDVAALLGFLFFGGFEETDAMARSAGGGPVTTGLLFAGIIAALKFLLQLPFSVYRTFVIEQRFGFNLTAPKTFVGDLLKGIALTAVLGGAVFAGLIWFFEATGEHAWLWAWSALTVFQLFLTWLAPVVLFPLFNDFKALPEGPLKERITTYARAQNFAIQGVYTMDGSKRSSKANAFFAGFGRFRRLVLFDTLIEKHSVDELGAVVAHEVGHFKLHHIPKSTALSIAGSLVLFRLLAEFIGNPALHEAFRMSHAPTTYAGLVFASILFGPVLRLVSLPSLMLSRRFEFEADAFAARTFGDAEALVRGLRKLSADSLSNPQPHPLKVLLDYTHPPAIRRIEALRAPTLTRR